MTNKKFLSLSQLKLEVKKYKINSQREYKKNRRNNWPSKPYEYYKDEWISWNDLFGKEEKVEFLSLSQLKLEVKKYNINSQKEYRKNRRKNWPSAPDVYYKDEWISWPNLFGRNGRKKEFLSLSQLKLEVKKYNISSKTEYNKNRKNNWPSRPDKYYKDEWISWNDLFGKEEKEKVEFLSLSQLKLEVKKYNINSEKEYRKNRRKNWPSAPDEYYKDEWISWNDLFGRHFDLQKYIARKLSA